VPFGTVPPGWDATKELQSLRPLGDSVPSPGKLTYVFRAAGPASRTPAELEEVSERIAELDQREHPLEVCDREGIVDVDIDTLSLLFCWTNDGIIKSKYKVHATIVT